MDRTPSPSSPKTPSTSTADPEPATPLLPCSNSKKANAKNRAKSSKTKKATSKRAKATGKPVPLPPEECLLRTRSGPGLRLRRPRQGPARGPLHVLRPRRRDRRLPPERRQGLAEPGRRRSVRFSKKGLFRVTAKLAEAQMERVRAARRFTVDLNIPAAPSYCRRYDTRHLTIKRTVHSQVVWFQSDSIFGASGLDAGEPPGRVGKVAGVDRWPTSDSR